jgi:hypothetical protein
LNPILRDYDYLFLVVFTIFIFTATAPSLLASYNAKMLVEGQAGNYEIKLDLNDSIMNLPNTTFILISVQDGNYYMVEKCIPAPQVNPVYAVPINKINAAKITRINSSNQITYLQIDRLLSTFNWRETGTQNNTSVNHSG